MQFNLPKVLQRVVLPGPILQTVQRIDEQSRRLDAAPQLDNLIDCQPNAEKVVGVLIVLPRELPVLELHRPMLGEMKGLLCAKLGIGLLHAHIGGF